MLQRPAMTQLNAASPGPCRVTNAPAIASSVTRMIRPDRRAARIAAVCVGRPPRSPGDGLQLGWSGADHTVGAIVSEAAAAICRRARGVGDHSKVEQPALASLVDPVVEAGLG